MPTGDQSGWVGGDVWDAAIVRDPLFDPNFAHWLVVRPCECPEYAMHSDNCSWTPIFAQLRTEMDLPTPWDWPIGTVYLEMRPDILGFDWKSVMGQLTAIEHVDNPIFPRYTVSEGSFQLEGEPDDPPWMKRQENPEL